MKAFIRKKYLEVRKQLSADFILKAGEGILKSFINSNFYSYNNFMAYYPINNEAPVNLIIEKLINDKKTVALPSTLENYNLLPIKFSDFHNVSKGKYDIPEPNGGLELNAEELDVVFVPGLAFDKSGGRVGYGKGCYDHFLSGLDVIKVGVCYEFQVLDEQLRLQDYDIRMDFLLTEKAIYEAVL